MKEARGGRRPAPISGATIAKTLGCDPRQLSMQGCEMTQTAAYVGVFAIKSRGGQVELAYAARPPGSSQL